MQKRYVIETGSQTGAADAHRLGQGSYAVYATPSLTDYPTASYTLLAGVDRMVDLDGWFVSEWQDGRMVEWFGTHDTLKSAVEAIIREAHTRALVRAQVCVTCGLPIFPTGADPEAVAFCHGRGRHGETRTITGPRQFVDVPRAAR